MNKSRTTNQRRVFVNWVLGISISFLSQTVLGLTFTLPHNGNIVGHLQKAEVLPGDTLSSIGLRYDMGGYEMVEANPGVSYLSPTPGSTVIIPSRFVLPSGTRKGMVINLAEMRLYYYHADGVHVSTYPVGVGQAGWNTPLGQAHVTRKRAAPTWYVPDSIYENELKNGIVLPKTVPPGGKNPLGDYAISLNMKNIVIHGSPYPKGVGVRSSHGCIRMKNEDVGELFRMVSVGTPVLIIDQPNKIGRLDNQLFLEAHVPMSKSEDMSGASYQSIKDLLHTTVGQAKFDVQWKRIERLQNSAPGYPMPIGSVF